MEPTYMTGVLYFWLRKLQDQSEMTTQLDPRTELMVGGKPIMPAYLPSFSVLQAHEVSRDAGI